MDHSYQFRLVFEELTSIHSTLRQMQTAMEKIAEQRNVMLPSHGYQREKHYTLKEAAELLELSEGVLRRAAALRVTHPRHLHVKRYSDNIKRIAASELRRWDACRMSR